MDSITFGSDKYMVQVVFEEGEDICKISRFESTRINSLKSRDIPITTEQRIWDSARQISVREDQYKKGI